MEDEIVQRRRQKILERANKQEQEEDQQKDEEDKFKIMQQLKQINQKEDKIKWILSITFGIITAILDAKLKLQIQYLVWWCTIYSIILIDFHRRSDKLTRKLHNEEFNKQIENLIQNQQLLGFLLSKSEKILVFFKGFKSLIESIIIFNVTFISVVVLIEN